MILVESGFEKRQKEMETLFLELHKKCEEMIDLTKEEQGIFDLLMWLYHAEYKPVVNCI